MAKTSMVERELCEVGEPGVEGEVDQPGGGILDGRFQASPVSLDGEPIPAGERGRQRLAFDQLEGRPEVGHLGVAVA